MQPDPFHFERCLTDDEREAATDLVTSDDNRALLKFAIDVLCLDKRQLVEWLKAAGDHGSVVEKAGVIAAYADMLHKLASVTKHAADTIAIVMLEPGNAALIGKGGSNARQH